jgi:tripartite-type tricarboxylate transporter receptor subunit TctC
MNNKQKGRATMLKKILRATTLLCTLIFGAASAQQFPTKPITLICPFSAGGSTDVVLRAIAPALGRELGQPVIIENRPGAGGTLGAGAMLNTKPDGYTLTATALGVFRIPLMQKAPYDPLKDLTYIISVTGYTFGLLVKADAPWKTLAEFVAYAKANPDTITYGTSGAGTTAHIVTEQFALEAGIKLTHIPFKGDTENMASLLGGHTMALSDSGWAPQVEAGKVRLLATYGTKRTKRWSQVPTLMDAGYKTAADAPVGFAGPKGMDPKVVKILHDAFKKAMDDPKVVEVLERFDQPIIYMNTADYTSFAKKMVEQEGVLLNQLGLAMKNP